MNAIKRITLFITVLSLTLPIAQPLFAAFDLSNPATVRNIQQQVNAPRTTTPAARTPVANQWQSQRIQHTPQNFIPQPAWISTQTAGNISLAMHAASLMGYMPSGLSTILHPTLAVAGYDRQQSDWPSKKEVFIRSLIAGYVINTACQETLSLIEGHIPDVPYIKSCLLFALCAGLGTGYGALYDTCESLAVKGYAKIKSLF